MFCILVKHKLYRDNIGLQITIPLSLIRKDFKTQPYIAPVAEQILFEVSRFIKRLTHYSILPGNVAEYIIMEQLLMEHPSAKNKSILSLMFDVYQYAVKKGLHEIQEETSEAISNFFTFGKEAVK